MVKKIRKRYLKESNSLKFKDIDTKLLTGWECIESTDNGKLYLDKLKTQTQYAMTNQKFTIT